MTLETAKVFSEEVCWMFRYILLLCVTKGLALVITPPSLRPLPGPRALLPCSTRGAFFSSAVGSTSPWHQWACVGLGRESISLQTLTRFSNLRGSDVLFRTSEAVALVGTYPLTLNICIHTQHCVHTPTYSYTYVHMTALTCTYLPTLPIYT